MTEANTLAEKIDLPGEQWQILVELGNLYRANGDSKKANQMQTRATEIMQSLADKIDDDSLRAGFLATLPGLRRS